MGRRYEEKHIDPEHAHFLLATQMDAGRRRLPLRIRDADELGWMEARGELILPEEVMPGPPVRSRVTRWLAIAAVVCVGLLVLALAARATDTTEAAGAADEAAPAAQEPSARELRDLRVRKCHAVVNALYPKSGFAPYCGYFIDEHERLGIADEWQWSLAYGGANFSLRVGAVAPGNCAGPMDVKHRPLVLDPQKNITWHCREMAYYHKRGRSGYRLVQTVFYPARPRDWGGGRIRRAYQRHMQAIDAAYKRGDLP